MRALPPVAHCMDAMQTPHDTLFAFTFAHPRHAAGWLRSVLPRAVAAAIDWPSLTPLRERFPAGRLRSLIADSGFVAAFLPRSLRDVLAVLLTEHRSFADPTERAQMLRYSVNLRRALQQRPGREPLLLAVVMRHVASPTCEVAPAPPPDDPLLTALLAAQPRQQVFVDDLDAIDEATLLAREQTPLATLTQLCLKELRHTAPDDVPRCFERWQHLLRAVDRCDGPPDAPPLGADAVDIIGWYALAVTEVDSLVLTETFSRILHRNDITIMSTLERTFQRGLAVGKAEGKVVALLRLVHRRFGAVAPEVTAQLHAGSNDQLDRWLDRVLDAPTVAELLAADRPRTD